MTDDLAVVTGGTRGIGAAISKLLSEEGYMVVANYHSSDKKAEAFASETGVSVKKWDVSDYDACANAISEIEEEFGTKVSVLVNNAGITKDGMLHKMDPQSWYDVINNNLNSCFNMCHSVIGKMREAKYGRIINISSINAHSGQMGQTNYSAAKAGILGFTKSLALESALKNITVNAVAPGYINTEMVANIGEQIVEKIKSGIPVKRLGEPYEIARVVAFLASKDSGFINGETISANGGQYMK